jgi:FlaA1/EpsC-like NDP-sugar epimerase
VRQLLEEYGVGELIALDNNESELFFLEQTCSEYSNASFFLADVRDREKLSRKMRHMNVVFHVAAFKHVILCERSPFEAVQTNILGVQNVVSAASENKVERVIFTSSDKAVNPTSVMGTSKLMGERLSSRGSVIPIFRAQIQRGGPVTLTDPGMTRFIMSIQEAVRLVIDSAYMASGGEVFVTKMPVIKITDLAEVMIQELAPLYGYGMKDINIDIIGFKPGEKLYEELMNEEETRRAWELERYFVVLPAFTCLYRNISYDYQDKVSETVAKPYNSESEKPLSKKQLAKFLRTNNLLEGDPTDRDHPAERYWPDDSCQLPDNHRKK